MKWIHLVLWTLVIFSICNCFAQVISVSETPSQQAFRAGIPQRMLGTLTPMQQAYEISNSQAPSGIQTAPEMQASGLPQITITSPRDGDVIPAGNVTVMVDVTNFNLVNMLGTANVTGEGHIHYYMDVPVPETPDMSAVTAAGTYASTIDTSFTWMSVEPGRHNFSAQLVNNDHTSLIPLVYDTINITAT